MAELRKRFNDKSASKDPGENGECNIESRWKDPDINFSNKNISKFLQKNI